MALRFHAEVVTPFVKRDLHPLISMSRSPLPHQLGTVTRCQIMAGSVSTSDKFTRRLPFVRGRPFVPGRCSGGGS